jgi:hypothetical protein
MQMPKVVSSASGDDGEAAVRQNLAGEPGENAMFGDFEA